MHLPSYIFAKLESELELPAESRHKSEVHGKCSVAALSGWLVGGEGGAGERRAHAGNS